MKITELLGLLSSIIALVTGVMGYFYGSQARSQEEEARSLQNKIEIIYAELARSDVPSNQIARDEFYVSFQERLGQAITEHFDQVPVSKYMRKADIHKAVRAEVEWVRQMYLGPEDGANDSPPST